jgi:hypothetical protein
MKMNRRSEIIRIVFIAVAVIDLAASTVLNLMGDSMQATKYGVYACSALLFAALVKLEWL